MLFKKYLRYALPSILSMLIFSLYTMVDGMFVARGVGEQALASVNLSMPFTAFVFAIGITIATGVSTMIQIAFGKNQPEKAHHYFNQNILVVSIVSLVLTVATLLNLERIACFLGASPGTTLEYTKDYVKVIASFSFFFIFSYNLEILTRANGSPRTSTLGVLCGAFTNIILDYVFVIVFQYGIVGAAVATGLSQVVTASIFVAYFLRNREKLRFGKFRFQLSIYKKAIPIGLADGFTELSNGVIIFLFNMVILSYIGENGIVSYTVISYVNSLLLMFMTGISQGIQPLISFSYGQKDKKTYHKLLFYALSSVLVSSVASVVLVQFKADSIVGLFLSPANESLFQYSIQSLRIFSFSFLPIGYNVILAGFFAAIAKPTYSMTISLGRGLVILAGSLLVLPMLWGEFGIWISPTVSESICLVLTIYFTYRYYQEIRVQNATIQKSKAA